jgi:hypothetical protein
MKKILLSFAIIGTFVIALGIHGHAVWAGEADVLIDVLEKKGVLTPEEAKDAAAEMKKAEAEATPAELPKGLKGISIGGTYFLEYYHKDFDDDTIEDFGSFKVERAYLTIKKKFTPWFGSRLTADITYDSKRGDNGADASEVGWEFRLKYAYGKFDFKDLGGSTVHLSGEVGLVHTFSDDYDSALWPYRCQGKHYLDRHSIMSSADFGLNAKFELGSMDKDFKKRVSKKYAAKWGGIWLGAYNGSGYNKSEVNDNKVVEAGIYIRPLNMIKFLEGFRIGVQYLDGESNKLLSGGSPNQYANWEITQFMASYQHEYFTIMGQIYDGKGEDTATDESDREGYNIAGFVRMPFHKPLRIFARYDIYDDDASAANTDKDEKTTIYGISYDLTKGVMPWVAIEKKDFEDPADGDDYDMIQVGLQIKF